MKRWRLSAAPDGALPTRLVTELLAGVGTHHLARSYLQAMQRALPVTFCTVFAVDATGRIETVSAASSYGDTSERTAQHYVRERYDLRDANMVWLAARQLPRQLQLWMGHQHADDIADAAYRAACYTDVGIRERASVLQLWPSGQRAAVSFYRSLAQPAFGAEDFAHIAQHAALLAAATAAHGRSSAPAVPGAAPLAARVLTLSLREREVIGHLMRGCTAKEAARALGLALSTVRTHQYRAFRRLGIRTQKELLRGAVLLPLPLGEGRGEGTRDV